VFGSRMIGISGGNGEATLIVAINHGGEVLGKEVAAVEVHLVNEAVCSYFLNECAKG